MTRAASRVKHDEIVRMVKAVRQCGLPISEVVYEDGRVRLVIGGDSGEQTAPSIDTPDAPENFDDLDDYLAWREKERAGGG